MLFRTTRACAVAAAFLVGPIMTVGWADAATINMTYDFQLGDFLNANGPSLSPISRVSGSFSLSLDAALTEENSALVVKLNSETPRSTLGSPVDVLGLSRGPIVIDGAGISDASDNLGTNNFVLTIDLSNPAAPRFSTCDDLHGGLCGSLPGSTLAEAYTSPSDSTALFLATSGTIEARTITEARLQTGTDARPEAVSTVPLPGSLPMAGAALLVLAVSGYGMKRAAKTI